MRLTCLKIKGKRATKKQTLSVAKTLERLLKAKGFETSCELLTQTGIRIGLHSRCFQINTDKLGYNAYVEGWSAKNTTAGFKKTNLPTWDERVEFNDVLNNYLDKIKASARITSGPFTIRSVKDGRFEECHWWNQLPDYINVRQIQKVTPAMEAEAIRLRKLRAKELRSIARDKAEGNLVEVFVRYGERSDSHGVMTRTEYEEYTQQMSTGDFHMHYTKPVKPNLKLVRA